MAIHKFCGSRIIITRIHFLCFFGLLKKLRFAVGIVGVSKVDSSVKVSSVIASLALRCLFCHRERCFCTAWRSITNTDSRLCSMRDILPWAQYDNVKKWILVWIATPLLAQCLAMTRNISPVAQYDKKKALFEKVDSRIEVSFRVKRF